MWLLRFIEFRGSIAILHLSLEGGRSSSNSSRSYLLVYNPLEHKCACRDHYRFWFEFCWLMLSAWMVVVDLSGPSVCWKCLSFPLSDALCHTTAPHKWLLWTVFMYVPISLTKCLSCRQKISFFTLPILMLLKLKNSSHWSASKYEMICCTWTTPSSFLPLAFRWFTTLGMFSFESLFGVV